MLFNYLLSTVKWITTEECQAGSIIQISIIQIQGKGDVRDSLADIKWAREMGYAPEFTIGETVRWSSAIIG